MKPFIHYFLHFGAPLLIAYFFYKPQIKKIVIILWLTMLVDIDHLWATPIFDPDRCSINFHLLHTYPFIVFYFLLLFKKGTTRIIGIGLLLHMVADGIDCLW